MISASEAALLVRGHQNTASPTDDKFSQASTRAYRVFTDQWGREFGADVEKNTMHPCGPYQARFTAPIMPSQKYFVITDSMLGRIVIDVHRWRKDLLQAKLDWDMQCQEWAHKIGGTNYLRLIKDPDTGKIATELLQIVGVEPTNVEIVHAMMAGNRWVLGLRNPDGSYPAKPGAAKTFFPDAVVVPDVPSDPWGADDPWKEQEDGPANEVLDYPHEYSPGYWYLSDAHHLSHSMGESAAFTGTRSEAEEAIKLGRVPEPEKHDIDPSWGDG